MREYAGFVSYIMGNEFMFQLLLVSLLVVPWQHRRNLFPVRYGVSAAVIILISSLFNLPLPYYYLIIFAMFFGAVILSFDCKFGEALFVALNTYCVQFVISNITYMLYFLFSQQNWHFEMFFAVSVPVFVICCALFFFFYTLHIRKISNLQFNNITVLFSTAIFLVIAVFITYYMQIWIGNDNNALCIVMRLFSVIFGCTVFFVNILNMRTVTVEEEKKLLCALLNKDKEYYERARISQEKLNTKYHDLKQLVNKGEIDREYLKELDIVRSFFTGNRALDIILTEKAMLCEEENIRLICSVDGKLIEFMKPYHIYSLIGNAIDNAIESLTKVADSDKRELTLNIERRNDMCVISLNNYFEGSLKMKDGLPVTTKLDSDNHGYGIKSIRETVKSYRGELYISARNNMFTIMAVIPVR